MGRALVGCCVAAPAALSAAEEVSATPLAPPAAPGVVGQAGGGRPAGAVRAALAAFAAKVAWRAKALLWQQRLLQLRAVTPAAVPAAADRSSTAEAGKEEEDEAEEAKEEEAKMEEDKTEDGKEDAGEASPPPRSPSADSRSSTNADSASSSEEEADFAALHADQDAYEAGWRDGCAALLQQQAAAERGVARLKQGAALEAEQALAQAAELREEVEAAQALARSLRKREARIARFNRAAVLAARGAAPLPELHQEHILHHKELGEGTYGCVYLASLAKAGPRFAVKMLKLDDDEDEADGLETVADMEAEASVQCALGGHPCIVQVLATVHAEGGCFVGFGMELAERTLLHVFCEDVAPAGFLHSAAVQIVSALRHAHALGVLHLDIKPTNILVFFNGMIKVADFGMHELIGPEEYLEVDHDTGTDGFAAPEATMRDNKPCTLSRATDVYSVGAMLGTLLTGDFELPPGTLLGGEYGAWGPLVSGCMAAEPAQRLTPATVAAYLADFAAELCAPLPPLPAAAISHDLSARADAEPAAAAAAEPAAAAGLSPWDPEVPAPPRALSARAAALATVAPPGGPWEGCRGGAPPAPAADGAAAAAAAHATQRLWGGPWPGAGGLAHAEGGGGGKAEGGSGGKAAARAAVSVAVRAGGPLAPRAPL